VALPVQLAKQAKLARLEIPAQLAKLDPRAPLDLLPIPVILEQQDQPVLLEPQVIAEIEVYPDYRDYHILWDKRVLLVKKDILVFSQDPQVMAGLPDCLDGLVLPAQQVKPVNKDSPRRVDSQVFMASLAPPVIPEILDSQVARVLPV